MATSSPDRVAALLAREDAAEDAGTLAADDRFTCHTHGGMLADCPRSSFVGLGIHAWAPVPPA